VTLPLSYSRLRASHLAPTRHYGGQARLRARPPDARSHIGEASSAFALLRFGATPFDSLPAARCGYRPLRFAPRGTTFAWLASRNSRPAVRRERRLVARGGFEPPKPLGRQIYSLLRLTAPQPRQLSSSAARAGRHALSLHESGRSFVVLGKRCFLVLTLQKPETAQTGAGGGIRTPDRLITNQLLYQTELRQPDKACSLARSVPDLQPSPIWRPTGLVAPRHRANHLFSPVSRFRAKLPAALEPVGGAPSLSDGLEQYHARGH
jgi:hypothetical protein